jgi:8-amino-3,8-dideoxy-alpha-D-manno-octulosonate transaminase
MPGYEWLGDAEKAHIDEVLKTGILFRYEFENERNGVRKVEEFENKFARYNGAAHAHAVTSGSAALKVALAALGVGPGDEIITQAFTFIATFEAIIECGAVPVVGEIDDTLNLDPADFEKKITDKTKVVIPVHMLGSPARIEEINAIAKKRGSKVLEDTAQALGGSVGGKKLGSIGDVGTFSFDFYKTITTGEGGMVLTNDKGLYVRASEYADHGHDHNPNVGRALEGRSMLGFNYRMNELQGAVGLGQLGRLDDMLARQKANQAPLREALENIDGVTMRALPANGVDSHTHVCFFLESADKAQALHKKITEKGVAAVYFKNNFWHYLPNWEHLLERKTAWPSPYPFAGPHYGKDMQYSSDMTPQSDTYIERLIVMPVSLKTDEEQARHIALNVKAAAEEAL